MRSLLIVPSVASMMLGIVSCTTVPMTHNKESVKLADVAKRQNEEWQKESCTPPSDIPDPMTYKEMQQLYINDRVSLVICQYLVENLKLTYSKTNKFIVNQTK